MTDVQPRFEFRIWGEEVDDHAARLRSLATLVEDVVTDETYVVALGRDDANAKIRGGVLDIKILTTVSRGCEQWEPEIKEEFPIPAPLLAEEVLPRLGVGGMALDRESYMPSAFLDEVVHPHPGLRAADVTKRRLKFTYSGCLSELAEVAIQGRKLRTLAAESADLDALVEALRRLGIEKLENVSYPRAIKLALELER